MHCSANINAYSFRHRRSQINKLISATKHVTDLLHGRRSLRWGNSVQFPCLSVDQGVCVSERQVQVHVQLQVHRHQSTQLSGHTINISILCSVLLCAAHGMHDQYINKQPMSRDAQQALGGKFSQGNIWGNVWRGTVRVKCLFC